MNARIKSLFRIAVFSVALGAASKTWAEIKTYDFEGVINRGLDFGGLLHGFLGDLSLLPGQPLSGAFSYDTSAADGNFAPDRGLYTFSVLNPEIVQEFTVAGVTLKLDPYASFYSAEISDSAGTPPLDTLDFYSSTVLGVAPDRFLYMGLLFVAPGGFRTGDSLPDEIRLADFQGDGLLMSLSAPNDQVEFTLTSLTSRTAPTGVPESGSTLLLLGIGLFGLVSLSHRQVPF